jgi:hypothetical protein
LLMMSSGNFDGINFDVLGEDILNRQANWLSIDYIFFYFFYSKTLDNLQMMYIFAITLTTVRGFNPKN